MNLHQSGQAIYDHESSADRIRLNSQEKWQDVLQRVRSHIIQSDEHGLPRYGVLSILARRVPFHLYDHPAFVRLCRTAFTDGIHVFVHTKFLIETLGLGSDPSGGNANESHDAMVLVLLHELSHILLRHHTRLPGSAPPLLWAIACDIAINTRLLTAYPMLSPGKVFDGAWGNDPRAAEEYLGQSEEHILYGLWHEPSPDDAAFVDKLKASLRSSDESVSSELDARGQKQDVHGHLVSPESVSRTLDEHGLRHVRELLNLPDPHDKPAFQRLESASVLYLTGDLDRAKEIRQEHPAGGVMAGSHLEAVSSEWIENHVNGHVEWKNLLRELVLGEGMRYEYCDEVPSDIYFVEPQQMGLEAPLFVGSLTPASPTGLIITVIDTSRSVSIDLLRVFIAELNNLIEQECLRQDQVYIITADTTLRSDITTFSNHALSDSPEKICLHGRGGTDISRVLCEVLDWTEQQQEFSPEDLGAIVYFTDLLDRAPIRKQLPEQLPKLLFLSPPSSVVAKFRSQVEAFANVAEIRDGTVIDL